MPGSVTGWIDSLKYGSDEAAEALWERLFDRLCRRIAPYSRSLRLSDDEDIASGTFAEFCHSIRAGKFDRIADRNELWKLLATMAVRKTRDCYKYENALCRGGDRTIESLGVIGEAESFNVPQVASEQVIDSVLEELMISVEDDADMKRVLNMKVQGIPNQDIADEIGCSLRTIQYMIKELTIQLMGTGLEPARSAAA